MLKKVFYIFGDIFKTKNIRMKKKLILLTVFFNFLSLEAQVENYLDSLIATGRTLPLTTKKHNQNVVIIDRETIQNTPSQSVEEIISYFSGIDLRRRGVGGMQSDIAIRGGNAEQVLLLVNGVRVTNPQTAHNLWNIPFDADAIERIEIIKGPEAAQYGANAFAGVINVITRAKEGKKVQLSAEAGSYGTYKVGTNISIASPKVKHLWNANYGASDGYRHNTDYTNKNMFYQGKFQSSIGEFNLQAGFGEKKFGANGFYASPTDTEQYEETQNSIVSLGLDTKKDNWGIRARTYWTRAQDMYLLNRKNPQIYRNMHIGNNLGAEVSVSFKNDLGLTSIGSEYKKEYLNSSNLGSHERDIISVFFEHQFSFFNEKLNIIPGASWFHFSNVGDFFYPQLGAAYKINAENKLFANAARVHRLPSYTEWYYQSPTEVGNPDLKPESANSFELGYHFMQPTFSAKVSAFRRYAKNAIDWVKQSKNQPWKPINSTSVTVDGVEVNLKKNFNGFVRSFAVDYTYLDKSIVNSEFALSRYLLDNLRHQVVVKLENQWFNHFYSHLVYRYLDRVTMENYHLLDAKLNYKHQNWQIFTSFNNLTGTKYTETNLVQMPGFWVSGGVTYQFNFSN